jgi:NAD(P)H-nitrite reductase large subunit
MEEIICYCGNVTKGEIETAISKGARTLKDVQEATGACIGNKCKELNPRGRCCSTEIQVLLNDRDKGQPHKCSCCG